MRNLVKILIVPIIIAIVGGSYAWFINRQVVDIRYTLSENIPINISNQSQSVQQLIVKNLGNSKAEKVVVNIQGEITDYELVKYSEADNVQNFNKSGGIQIIYPELPPEGTFKITIKSDGKGVSIGDVKISHNKGEAYEALANTKNDSPLVSVIVFFIYIISIVLFLWSAMTENLQRKAISGIYYKKILEKKHSPFYISNKMWIKIREDSIDTMIRTIEKNNFYIEFEESECYKVLSAERPEYLTDEEWVCLCKKLNEICEINIKNMILKGYNIEEFIKILRLKKPKQLDEHKWNDIRKRTINAIIVKSKEDDYLYILKSIEELEVYKLLCNNTPDYLNITEWNDFSKDLMEILEKNILQKVSSVYCKSEDLLSYLKVDRPHQYKEVKWKMLMNELYDKYILLKKKEFIEKYYISLDSKEVAKELVQDQNVDIPKKYLDEYIGYVKEFYKLNLMNKIYTEKDPISYFNNQLVEYSQYITIGIGQVYSVILTKYYIENINKEYEEFSKLDKPDWIMSSDYNKILEYLRLSNELKILISENNKNRSLIEEEKKNLIIEKNRIKELIDRITLQLEIINNVLTDPKSIERIESYNDIFANGNFENLKKIAFLLNAEGES